MNFSKTLKNSLRLYFSPLVLVYQSIFDKKTKEQALFVRFKFRDTYHRTQISSETADLIRAAILNNEAIKYKSLNGGDCWASLKNAEVIDFYEDDRLYLKPSDPAGVLYVVFSNLKNEIDLEGCDGGSDFIDSLGGDAEFLKVDDIYIRRSAVLFAYARA